MSTEPSPTLNHQKSTHVHTAVKESLPTPNDTPGEVHRQSSTGERDPGARWTFLSNHTHVLLVLFRNPSIVLREVAMQVGITERAVQRIVADLEDEGFLQREKIGRQNHYRVIPEKRLRHPIEQHCTIGELLKLICETNGALVDLT